MDEQQEFLERRIGTTIRGKWRIERLLGAGGMAAVYVGVHSIGHRAALKILHPEVAAVAELRARFEQEAHAVNRFTHPGAVAITDHDVAEDGCPFLVMELLEGESLHERIEREKQIEPAEVLRIADELLDVLAAAHAHGIIHRDIKPDNLFLQRDGRVKVLDFGIARMKEGTPKSFQTRTGVAMGTVTYMPPEQIKGEKVDGRADLFAVGATMFRMLTGQRVHDAETHADMLIKMASLPAPALAGVAPHLPSGLCRVVDRALAFSREERYTDALTMQADVRALRQGRDPVYAMAPPVVAPIAFAATAPGDPLSSVRSARGVSPAEPTRRDGLASAQVVDPTRPDQGAVPPIVAESHPPAVQQTWVSGEGRPGVPSAGVAAVQVVAPQGHSKRSAVVMVLAVVAVVALVLSVGAVAIAAWALSSRGESSGAESDAAAEPSDTAESAGGQTTATATATATATGKTPATATATAPTPQSTGGAAPPGKDKKKDKGGKNH